MIYFLGWVNFIVPVLATQLVLRRLARICSFKNKQIQQLFFFFSGVTVFCFSVVLAFMLLSSLHPEYAQMATGQ